MPSEENTDDMAALILIPVFLMAASNCPVVRFFYINTAIFYYNCLYCRPTITFKLSFTVILYFNFHTGPNGTFLF